MEEGEEKELCRQLGVTDSSLGFLLFIVAGVLLSFWSVTIQRRQLCLTIAGETEAAAATHDVFPLRRTSSALILGALVFFLLVALRARQEACRGEDAVAARSAGVNLWASILVLAAAVLRFDDLHFVENSRQAALLEDDVLPA